MTTLRRLCIAVAALVAINEVLPVVQGAKLPNQPRPYRVSFDQTVVADIRFRASHFRPTPNINVPIWSDGAPGSNLTSIAKYWASEFDFGNFENEINSNFSHYITAVPPPGGTYNRSLEIHFIHQVSQQRDAIPILFLHGWPSTSLEWTKIIPALIAPPNASLPAFHAIAPDLPGYGFSPAPTAGGLGSKEHAIIFVNLMQQLGYERYAIYSTDLSATIAQRMVEMVPQRVINHVTDFFLVMPNATDQARYAAKTTTLEETAYIESLNHFGDHDSAYALISATVPLSVAYAFSDSPVGFVAWVWQLVYFVDDTIQTAEKLIRRTLLLYLPGPYNNIRTYKELFTTVVSLSQRLIRRAHSCVEGSPGHIFHQKTVFVHKPSKNRTLHLVPLD
jgi:pimeloyl-ACP methyl ester carboxylesterase